MNVISPLRIEIDDSMNNAFIEAQNTPNEFEHDPVHL